MTTDIENRLSANITEVTSGIQPCIQMHKDFVISIK